MARSIRDRADGKTVYDILSRSLKVRWEDYTALVAYADRPRSPFSLLVALVLSQNTSDINSIRAYRRLKERVGLDPESIANADTRAIEEAIRPAGLASRRAETLKRLARFVIDAGGEDFLSREDPFKLRETLLKIKGVGFKTVDVFLSLYRRAPVFAVDTHAARIAKRWGLVGGKAGYREISDALLRFFGADASDSAHRLLIALGRTYCRARNPRCSDCPLRDLCPYPEKATDTGKSRENPK